MKWEVEQIHYFVYFFRKYWLTIPVVLNFHLSHIFESPLPPPLSLLLTFLPLLICHVQLFSFKLLENYNFTVF